MSEEAKNTMIERALIHLHFCLELYQIQVDNGRYFLHEHPATATSWKDPKVQEFIKINNIESTVMHMCQYGMTSTDKDGTVRPVYKPSKWISNSKAVLSRLTRKCTRDHQHGSLLDGKAKHAAIYPPDLCLQILRGVRDQIRHDESGGDDGACSELMAIMTDQDIAEVIKPYLADSDLNGVDHLHNDTKFYDDTTGLELDPDLVREARQEEIDFFHSKGVYKLVRRAVAFARTGKAPITIRWVYVNKGDDEHPDIRARLVAREIRKEASDGSMFAATPPLEAIKFLLSLAASSPELMGSKDEIKISFVDARRAYFNAECKENVFVELPHEDHVEGMCGQLVHWMYGTQKAASKWEQWYSNVLIKHGFTKGKASPCTFHHKAHNLRCVVHGDDFTTSGTDRDLNWFEAMLSKEFEVKVRGRLGSGPKDLQEIRILNRIARRTSDGYEWESDPRHAELIVKQMGVQESNSVVTPGVEIAEVEQDKEELEGEEATSFRGLAARANFLSMDRADIQFATKEICRKMAKPRRCDWAKLKRLARYLVGKPRMVQSFPWQRLPDRIDCYVDTDYAGCLETRKSTSGGVILHGTHCLRTWSTTQSVVALSSGEAELYGIVKGASMSIGLQSVLKDIDIQLDVIIHSDSAAARGMVKRNGLGKVRHIHVQELWVQDALREGRFKLQCVLGYDNCADLLTKHLEEKSMVRHAERIGLAILSGRSEIAPHVT